METNKKKRRIVAGVVTAAVIIAAGVCTAWMLARFFGPFPVHETNDIADYGEVVGNYDNDTPKEFISSFFPAQIDESFKDVTYHYKAIKGDTYAYEMYLEFVIEDQAQYDAFVASAVNKDDCTPFAYDPDYREYIVSNYFLLNSALPADPPLYIENAEVGRVLFSDSEQKIIFFALGMYDGGGANTDELGYFFDKFNIDPVDFEKQAWPGIL